MSKDYYILNREIKRFGDDFKLVAEDDDQKTYNVYICEDDIKHYLNILTDKPLDLTLDGAEETIRDASQGIIERFVAGSSSYEVTIQAQKIIGYRFYRKQGGHHDIDVKRVGNPKTFLQKETNYTYFEAIFG